jgi:hypothetical protein
MRALALAAFALMLAGCAGVIDYCPDGLRDSPWRSGSHDPHDGP